MTRKIKKQTVKIALIVFSEKEMTIFPETTKMLEKWIKQHSVQKSKERKKKDTPIPSLVKGKGVSTQRSICSILSTGSKKRASFIAAGPISPLVGVPSDVCNLIWEYLSPVDIARAARVNKTWNNFSKSFLYFELGEAIATGSKISQVKDVEYSTHRKKVTKETSFRLNTFVVQDREDFLTQAETSFFLYNFVFFIFETKITNEDFKLMLEIYDTFYKSKTYHSNCPAVILTQDEQPFLDLKKEHKADFVQFDKELNAPSFTSANILLKERIKKQKRMKRGFTCKDVCALTAFSIIISIPFFLVGAVISFVGGGSTALYIGLGVIGMGVLLCCLSEVLGLIAYVMKRPR